MREAAYQADLIKTLRRVFPGCFILKNDTDYLQGVPDLLVLYKNMWAMLEVKAHRDAVEQPNQRFYIDMLDDMSFASFIYPENEQEVLDDLQRAFGLSRPTRVSKRQ